MNYYILSGFGAYKNGSGYHHQAKVLYAASQDDAIGRFYQELSRMGLDRISIDCTQLDLKAMGLKEIGD